MDFQNLLQKAQNLNSFQEKSIPKLQKPINQVNVQSRKEPIEIEIEIETEKEKETESKIITEKPKLNSNKVRNFLSKAGFESDKFIRELSKFQSKNINQEFNLDPIIQTKSDLNVHFKNIHETIILKSIEETIQKTISKSSEYCFQTAQDEWESSKNSILEKELKLNQMDYFQDSIQNSQSKDIQIFSQAIINLNFYRNKKQPYGIINVFQSAQNQLSALSDLSEKKIIELNDIWELLACIISEKDVKDGIFQNKTLQEQHYLIDYQEKNSNISKTFIRGALDFLESQYTKFIRNQIQKNPRKAKVGGVPGIISLIYGFLNIQFKTSEDHWPSNFVDFVDGIPVWPIIYYLLRCGELESILKFLIDIKDVASNDVVQFLVYFKEYIENDGILSEYLWTRLFHQYRNIVHTCDDPYKQIVFNIIGKCDIHSMTSILNSLEDYIWFMLLMIQDDKSNRTALNEIFTLEKLQENILEYGEKHFNPTGKKPLQFFRILLLSQLFECAVAYLIQYSEYYYEAVHFAIALYYYGILNYLPIQKKEIGYKNIQQTKTNPKQKIKKLWNLIQVSIDNDFLVLNQEKNIISFMFSQMIKSYIHRFYPKEDHLDISLNYLNIIRDKQDLYYAVKDLVLETHQIDYIFGKVDDDQDNREEGIVFQIFQNLEMEEIQEMMKITAIQFEENGLYEEAIRIYDFANFNQKAIDLLNQRLSRIIGGDSKENESLIELAQSIRIRYQSSSILWNNVNPESSENFVILLYLIDFFYLYSIGEFGEALSIIENLKLVPFDSSQMNECMIRFASLGNSIKKIFSQILLVSMTILFKIFESNQIEFTNDLFDGGQIRYLNELKSKASNLMKFCGIIPLRIPENINSKLVKMSVMMK
ncbi:nuclear pore complex protein nup93 [Anaeramoeba ignava]|uniref:Nuclear pore protein n=1 Tax=Anaeramoeba ignava TaxID=1746090 RepID=A0A9Q0RH30_ANAIG|nr:nuclear pore complex protein nup93 [Anaeramoeba ignava]